MTATRTLIALVAASAIGVLAGAGPALAGPPHLPYSGEVVEDVTTSVDLRDDVQLTIAHQPQPAAYRGQDIVLPVAITSSCSAPRASTQRHCSDIRVEVHWQTGAGGGILADHVPLAGGARTFAVPGSAVEGDLTYWIEAHQLASPLACLSCWDEEFSARSPHTDALFHVSVIND